MIEALSEPAACCSFGAVICTVSDWDSGAMLSAASVHSGCQESPIMSAPHLASNHLVQTTKYETLNPRANFSPSRSKLSDSYDRVERGISQKLLVLQPSNFEGMLSESILVNTDLIWDGPSTWRKSSFFVHFGHCRNPDALGGLKTVVSGVRLIRYISACLDQN